MKIKSILEMTAKTTTMAISIGTLGLKEGNVMQFYA